LGNGKTTVIAIHHQWLYGRSAVVNLINIMDFTDDKVSEKTLEDIIDLPEILASEHNRYIIVFDEFQEIITKYLSIL
jgi:hypothetical protein